MVREKFADHLDFDQARAGVSQLVEVRNNQMDRGDIHPDTLLKEAAQIGGARYPHGLNLGSVVLEAPGDQVAPPGSHLS